MTKLKRSLRLPDVILMNIVAVVSLRWIASAASIGPSSLVLWFLACLLFFVPQGLAVAELSSRYPAEGGLYRWTQRAFGERSGFICGWCYWVNNLLYFPSILMFVSANVAFGLQWLHPEWQWVQGKHFVVVISLSILWLVGLLSFVGMQAGKWLQNIGSVGNWIPAMVIVVLGTIAYFSFGSANPISLKTLTPNLGNLSQLSFFAQMCFALAGLELVSFLGGEIDNPRKTLTRAILIAGLAIFFIYILATLGILVSVPQDKITVINGIILPIQEVSRRLQLPWIAGLCALWIALAGVGSTMAWFAGVARVPYLVGVDNYLPKSFGKLHPKFQTPHVAILVQLLFATLFALFATAGASTKIESAYLLLVDMCLILYFIPYCYLFLSFFKLGAEATAAEEAHKIYHIPGGRPVVMAVSTIGFATTLLAIAMTLYPGSDFTWPFFLKTIAGTALMLLIGVVVYYRGKH